MTREQWDTIALLLDKGFKWREPFGEAHDLAYRTLLEGCEAAQIANVLRALVARGQVFGPTPGEIVALVRHDPDNPIPTFEECFQQLYGPGGLFGFKRSGVTVSPWVTAFADGFGRERLRLLEVDDETDGKWRRRELEQAWDRFVEASEGRELAQIAAGRRGAIGRFDPAAALGVPTARIGSGSG